MPGWYIVLCYALPNALIPSITVLGLVLVICCMVSAHRNRFCLARNGCMGSNINTGARLPAVMGFAVAGSFAYVLVNLVVDLLYLWIDPRIGRGGGE
ncbi:ABC transporter permease subunit [Shigella boydii]